MAAGRSGLWPYHAIGCGLGGAMPSSMAAYGACIQLNMPDVGKGACEREMEALKACVFAKK